MKEIVIFSTKTCAYCDMVKKRFDALGAKYIVHMLDDDPAKAYELQKITGATTVPITTDGEEYIIGPQWAKLNAMAQRQLNSGGVNQ